MEDMIWAIRVQPVHSRKVIWTSLGFFGSAKVVQGGIVIIFLSKENMGV
jgi:hypothetical protein